MSIVASAGAVGLKDAPERETVRVLRTEWEWAALEREWRSLCAGSRTAVPPLRWEWQREWWRHYAASCAASEGLRLVTIWRGRELLGVLPLYQERSFPGGPRRLVFLSTGEPERDETCPDYLDLLARSGEEESCIRAVATTLLRNEAGPWDELLFAGVADGGLLTRLPLPHVQVLPGPICAQTDLSGGFEGYLASLPGSRREQYRRLLRGVAEEGMNFEVCGPGEVDAYFAQLVDLHQQRWTASGKPGCFASERFTRFHHSLAHTLVPAGQAILARLRHGAGPLAVLYGFTTGTKFDFYQCGVLPERHGKVKSPGTVVHLLLMEWLAGRGFTTYDFLRGSADYKKRLATASRQLVTVQVTRPTLRTAAGRTAELLGRAVRRSARMITRQTAPGRGLQSEATR